MLTPDDADYDEARAVWNGAIDRRPAFIARCASSTGVAAALRFAFERDLPFSVRGGGHSIAGTSVCDGGVVIDLAPMKALHVDPGGRRARAGAGLVWGELDDATQAFGLATTGGVMSRTGIAGLTLGGVACSEGDADHRKAYVSGDSGGVGGGDLRAGMAVRL